MNALLRMAILAALITASTGGFFYFRDNVSTHFPMKVLQARALAAGELPLWTRASGGGQPMAGNPNFLTFYPDTILYLVLPPIVAFNVHFILHLAAGFLTMRLLLRTIGVGENVATRCAALYLFSGAALSVTVFYNLVVAFALVPLAAASTIRLRETGNIRDAFVLGVTCGLLGLAAEPMIIASTILLLLVFALDRLLLRRAVQLVLAILIAIIVAMPQLIAFSEIVTDIERASYRFSAETVLNASLSPQRLAEVVLGPIQGRITDLSSDGFGPQRGERFPPFLPSVFLSSLLLPALAFSVRVGTTRAALAFLLLLFFALGRFNPAVAFLVDSVPAIRIGRFPEKLLIVAFIAAVVLIAAAGSISTLWRKRDVAMFGVAPLLALAAVAWVKLPEDRALIVVLALLQLGVLVAAARSTRLAIDASIAIGAICFFWQLPFDRHDPYDDVTKLRAVVPAAASIVHDSPSSARRLRQPESTDMFRSAVIFGDPIIGAKDGIRYVLDGSPDGMHSFLSRIARERSAISIDHRLRYATLGGAAFIVAGEPRGAVAGDVTWGPNRALISSIASLPPLHAPARLHAVSSVNDAVATIESAGFRAGVDAVVPAGVTPVSNVDIIGYQEQPNGFRAHVAANEAAVLITRESWFRAWSVEVDGEEVRTFPANLDRLAFVVPEGARQITATFSRRSDVILYSWLVSLSICAIAALLPVIRSRKTLASPAR